MDARAPLRVVDVGAQLPRETVDVAAIGCSGLVRLRMLELERHGRDIVGRVIRGGEGCGDEADGAVGACGFRDVVARDGYEWGKRALLVLFWQHTGCRNAVAWHSLFIRHHS